MAGSKSNSRSPKANSNGTSAKPNAAELPTRKPARPSPGQENKRSARVGTGASPVQSERSSAASVVTALDAAPRSAGNDVQISAVYRRNPEKVPFFSSSSKWTLACKSLQLILKKPDILSRHVTSPATPSFGT